MKDKIKLMNSRLAVLILLLSVKMYSQETGVELPDMTPPSPEAYELTKYGNIPISEYTGMVSTTIPLYNLKSGNLELPISLNYNGSGVKVNQLSTWTGINWTLSAGGVITRTVHDDSDEHENVSRLSVDEILAMNLTDGSSDAEILTGIFRSSGDLWDFKPDEFNFSFSGYSGNFYLDVNYLPTITKRDSPLKIEIIGSNPNLKTRFRESKEFCITTPDGVKYYFGGSNATEHSYVINFSGGSHSYDNVVAPTSFYLTRIVHPINGVIFFEYVSNSNPYLILQNKTYSKTIITEEEEAERTCYRPSINTDLITTATNNKILETIYLSKIKSIDYTEISFNSSQGSSLHFRKVLNNIEVKHYDILLKEIKLFYDFSGLNPSTSDRFFLNKVEINKDIVASGDGEKYEVFRMEYDDLLGLPNRFSFAQDHNGYYNGKNSNIMLLPQNDDVDFNNYYSGLANRGSDFNYSKKGSLKRIYYPAKGFTEFEYEPVYAKDYNTTTKSLMIWRNSLNRIPSSQLSNQYTGVGDFVFLPPVGDEEPQISGNYGSLIDQDLQVNIFVSTGHQMGHTDIIRFKLTDITASPNVSQITNIIMPDGNQSLETGRFDFARTFTLRLLKDHEYRMELYNSYSSPIAFEATASFKFIKGYKLIEDGGIRIKRVTDYTSENNKAFVKRYYYSSANQLSKNIFDLINMKRSNNYVRNYFVTKCMVKKLSDINPVSFCVTHNIAFKKLSTSNNVFVFDKKYDYVTTSYGGDDFEQGGIEKQFSNVPQTTFMEIQPYVSSIFQDEKDNYRGNLEDINQGVLLKTTDLIKKNGGLYKISEATSSYQSSAVGSIKGFVGGEAYVDCMYFNNGATNFDLNSYTLFSHRFQKISEKVMKFFTPVPVILNESEQASYPAISHITNYEYGELAGLPTRIISSTSESGINKIVRNYYPNEATNFSDLSLECQDGYSKLIQQNRVNNPVQVEKYSNTQLLSKQRTVYKSWNSNSSHVLPEKIMTSKGVQDFEDRIVFTSYDLKGNPEEVLLKDGSKIRYYYNNENQVIRKIENYQSPAQGSEDDEPFDLPFDDVSGTCGWHTVFPNSLVTSYYYSPITNLLTRIIDSNCRSTYYEYDELQHLKKIKDHDGNVLKEFDNNFRPQN